MTDPRDKASPSPSAVVIGGSAGALEALMRILPRLPGDFPLPVICVVHLLPRSRSLLPEIFSDLCRLPAKEAESTEEIRPRMIYFAPPDVHLSIEMDRTFSFSNEDPRLFSRPSIDVLFESAAWCYRQRLAAILLSGANADGAEGLAFVQARGGRVLVQDPKTCEFSESTEAALARVKPDGILSPDAIGVRLADLGLRDRAKRNEIGAT